MRRSVTVIAEVGYVSADASLADFYSQYSGFTRLEVQVYPTAASTASPDRRVLKVFVPAAAPPPAPATERFTDMVGIRYITVRSRRSRRPSRALIAHGGTVVMDRFETAPGRATRDPARSRRQHDRSMQKPLIGL